MQSYLQILPERLRRAFGTLENVDEIRLRAQCAPGIVKGGVETCIRGVVVDRDDLTAILRAASNGSLYTEAENLKQGFLTLPGGHRIGVCGTAVMKDGVMIGMESVSSLCIRIAAQKIGVGENLRASTLIVGPPGCGKTTFLRDCVRILSSDRGERVGLADERCEVAAALNGVPQLDVGNRTDIISRCPKATAVDMLLRTMNPQWIAVDEITREEDADALIRGSYCGVKLLATAHIRVREDLEQRPVYRRLLRSGIFSDLILLQNDHTRTRERLGV